jgi:CBS domain containing-hemolysin-like protein
MTALFAYAAFTLGVSFTCSFLEAVLLCVTPSYIAHLATEDARRGAMWHDLKLRIDRPIAAILSLNTIANTFGAAMVGATAQELWGSHALTIASVLLTLLILICSEIVPKTLGAVYWRQLAPFAGPLIVFLVRVLTPLVWLIQRLSRALASDRPSNLVQREELAALAALGDRQGMLDAFESRVMQSLLRFRDVRISDIMTPRIVVSALDATDTVRDALANEQAMRFSRIPVQRAGPDDVVGYVLKEEVLLHAARGQTSTAVGDMLHEFLVVPESLPVAELLDQLLERRDRIALCLNEYGGFEGVATLEDVVETVLGTEIVGKLDPAADMRALARARWRERAQRLGLGPDATAAGSGGTPPKREPTPEG